MRFWIISFCFNNDSLARMVAESLMWQIKLSNQVNMFLKVLKDCWERKFLALIKVDTPILLAQKNIDWNSWKIYSNIVLEFSLLFMIFFLFLNSTLRILDFHQKSECFLYSFFERRIILKIENAKKMYYCFHLIFYHTKQILNNLPEVNFSSIFK